MERQNLVDLMMDEDLLFADGFDSAILGVDINSHRVVYSYALMAEQLILEGMTYEDAIEYLDFNVVCAYVGERTPIYIYETD